MRVYYAGNFWAARTAARSRTIGMDVLGTYVVAHSVWDAILVAARLLVSGCTVERLAKSR
jgi:hypothetical protein